ncbi:hypothetical protein PVAP13_4NG264511 [Panicum virgatum]|uniref:Uncharacterized protein n=1 Tax=Panicum virgatum TaxID=38727 RepID=A0A8T0T8C5_PANVG|nr:hypothetical protein PVAP13_4NG264511 [Panicum virgatum]
MLEAFFAAVTFSELAEQEEKFRAYIQEKSHRTHTKNKIRAE